MAHQDILSSARGAVLRDSDWVRKSFMLATKDMDSAFIRWRFATTASLKFTDTTLGGNWAINNPPQYTRFSDIRNNGINRANGGANNLDNVGVQGGRLGLGRYYNDAIDEQRQLVHMRFGRAEYNGMISFFTSFFDGDASLLANEGRGSITYYLGLAAGVVVSIGVFPYILLGDVYRFFFSSPSSRYYYLSPTPGLYLNRVNLIANSMAVNLGIVPRVFGSLAGGDPANGTGSAQPLNNSQEVAADDGSDTNYVKFAHTVLPDIFDENGGVNVFALINRSQRLASQFHDKLMADLAQNNSLSSPGSLYSTLKNYVSETFNGKPDPSILVSDTKPTQQDWNNFLARYHNLAIGNAANAQKSDAIARGTSDVSGITPETAVASSVDAQNNADKGSDQASTDPNTAASATANQNQQKLRDRWGLASGNSQDQATVSGYGKDGSFKDYWLANRHDGQDFITFGVDHVGTVHESFTNGARDSDIAQRVNGMSGTAKEARFSFSDGQTGIGMVDGALNAVRDFATGALDGLHLGGLLSLAGAAFVDIPKHWDNSSVTLPSSSYTMELRTPYGNKFARFAHLLLPMSFLLAAVLPISTGRQSYTGPFLLEMYHRGRNQIRLGMISDLSFTRGVGNMGWNRNSEFLGVDVSFTVLDLTSVLHMPIDSGFNLLKPWKGVLDPDNAFTDYMATLGNLSMADQIYPWRKFALNLTRKREQIDTFFSWAHVASATDNWWPTHAFNSAAGAIMRAGESTLNVQ